MTETPPEAPHYREPGVKYRRERRTRLVTTVIDGVESTHEEDYYVDVPVPPRDWETVVQRALFVWAGILTVAAFVGTCAAVGGLFAEKLHAGAAYPLGLMFTGSWLGLLGLEWLDGRIDPGRARPARVAGWVALAACMGAVFVFYARAGLPWVGAAGAVVDLSAKGFLYLLLSRGQVKLPKGVAAWVRHQEQRAAGRALLAGTIRRLNRYEAYQRAAGGPEYQAAHAALNANQTPQLPTADTSGQAAPVSGQAPVPAAAPVSGRVPDPSGPAPTTPPPAAPTPPPTAPVTPPAAPVPPVPPAVPVGSGASGSSAQHSGQRDEQEQPGEQGTTGTPPLQAVGPLSIAAAVRQARAEDPEQSDAEMVARVLELRGGDDGGDRVKFAETVARTRRRQESKERKAS